MTDIHISPARGRSVADGVGLAIAGVVTATAGVAAAFFAEALPPAALESATQSLAPADAALRALMAAAGVAPRSVSVGCVVAVVMATVYLGRRATGDMAAGAFLALAWILFPPVLAVHALATPIAPASLLVTVGLAALWPGPTGIRGVSQGASRVRDAVGALALMFAALFGAVGAWASLAAVMLMLLLRLRLWSILAPVIGVGLAIAAIGSSGSPFAGDASWVPPGRGAVTFGAVLPFAMIWVGSLLGAVASRAAATTYRLGLRVIWVCRAGPPAFAGLLALAAAGSEAPGPAYLVAGAAFLPIALIGLLPLVAWVRFAMPKIRSMPAWLAFPVIMYCCFWVVLGPITRDRFPFGLIPDLAAPFAGKEVPPP